MVKQAAVKTADIAGDGTTTSTLLAREMVKAGLNHLNNGANAVEIKRGIDAAVKQVTEELRRNVKEDTTQNYMTKWYEWKEILKLAETEPSLADAINQAEMLYVILKKEQN